MNADGSDAGNLERVVKSAAPSHPPCPQRCWERLGAGWAFTGSVNEACRWDQERKQWTECKEHK